MTELNSIFFLSLGLVILSHVPIRKLIFKQDSNEILVRDNILNYLLILNILLILTLLNFKLETILITILIMSLIICIFYFKSFIKFSFINFVILIAFTLICSIEISNKLILYWDSQKLWLPKALIFLNSNELSDLNLTARANYPFFGSIYWAALWKSSGLNYEYLGRIGYLFLFFLVLLYFIENIKLKRKIKLILFFLISFITYDYWHFRGTQEILVFTFILICTCSLYNIEFDKINFNKNIVIFFLSINLLIWTKNEGIFFALFLFLTLLILNIKSRNKIFFSIIFLILIIFRLFIFEIYGLKNNLSTDFDYLNILKYLTNNFSLENILFIIKHIIFTFFKFVIIFICLLFLAYVLYSKKKIKKINWIFLYPLLHISFIIFIYLLTKKDVKFMVETGLNRVLFESSSYYLIYILVFFNNLKIKIKNFNT